jgi:Metallo-peptidase family M12
MFSVTQYSCATGYYSFGHELGHNFGMYHDRGAENSCTSTSDFNYGYRNPNAEFRTILSYDCQIGQCDKMPSDGCPRIQRYSNSDTAYKYNGKAIGNAINDNARLFNNYRALVASYFPAMNCQSDTECNDNDANTMDTCNVVNRVCVFTPSGLTIDSVEPRRTFLQSLLQFFGRLFAMFT